MKSDVFPENNGFQALSKTKSALYARLGSAKVRRKEGLFMAVGSKCVADTRESFVAEAVIATPDWISAHENLIGSGEDQWNPQQIRLASAQELERISGMNSSPEVIAIYRIPVENQKDNVIHEGELALMLDGVQDPGNFGSILRTADWFGVTRVFASKESADIYNPKVIQATMGAVSRVRVVYTDLAEVIATNPGVPVYGTLLDGTDIYRTELSQHAILVMGNEGRGLSEEIRKLVTHKILIPPYNPVNHGESLNVGAATAITLATFRNR